MSTENPPGPTSRPEVSATASAALLTELRAALGPQRVSTRTDDRTAYSRDMWTRGLLAIAAGQPPSHLPGAIVWPETTAEVQAIVQLARRHQVPIVPFGSGSSVTGAAIPAAGGLVIDTKRMRKLQVDGDRRLITCEPGMLGSHLEERLNRQGLTLGHFPSSIMCSTVGGWLATRGAGQMSTKYGKIEDLVQGLEVVTGTGERLRLDSGDHGGPDLQQLLVGSEGTLGMITEASFAVRPVPAARLLRGYWFPDVASGCDAIRQVMQLGLRPAVVRLYDELDTLMAGVGRHGASPKRTREHPGEREGAASWVLQQLGSRVGKLDLGGPDRPPLEFEDLLKLLRPDAEKAKSRLERWLVQTVLTQAQPLNRLVEVLMPRLAVGCLLILGFEGEPELTAAEEALARGELVRRGARDLGEEPGQHWLRHRYDVSFKLPKAFAAGAFADTIEVATTWDRLSALYREVRAALGQHALVMAHFSHAYPDGCSIYFTLIGRALSTSSQPDHARDTQARLTEDTRRYDALWQAAMQAALRVGATISHHHGIGTLRTPHMAAEHGSSLLILRALKKVCDPDGVCNPGKLLPAVPVTPPQRRGSPPPPVPNDLAEALRTLLGPERVEHRESMLRCAVRNGTEVQAVRRAAFAHGVTVSCAKKAPRDAGVQLDLSGMSHVAPVRLEALLVEAQCGITLWQLEHGLRTQGLSLGALPPWAWTRTLGAALAAPRPSEASLDCGRLRDRRVRLTAVLPTGQEITVPPTPAPRRAAGPDLAQVLLGSGDELGVLTAAMLRVQRHPSTEQWIGLLFDEEEAAVRALGTARSLHGGTALTEAVLLHRELLARTLDLGALPPGRLALLVASAGPEPLATSALRLLGERLGPQHPPLPAAACRDLYRPDALFAPGASLADAARLGADWPRYERPLDGPFSEQAALLKSLHRPYAVGGVYLHGAALCAAEPVPTAATSGASAPADPQTTLWPRLRTAVLGELDPLG